MQAPQAQYITAPQYNYNDRSALPRYNLRSAGSAMSRGLLNNSAQGRSAERASIRAPVLAGENQISQEENMRRDTYDRGYEQRMLQTNAANTQIANQNLQAQTGVANEKIGLGIANRNALLQGIMGNQAVRKQEELDRERIGTILAQLPDLS